MPAKVKLGRRSGEFLPLWPYPLYEGAPWLSLGCWTAKIAITLDTVIRILLFRPGANGTGVPKSCGSASQGGS